MNQHWLETQALVSSSNTAVRDWRAWAVVRLIGESNPESIGFAGK